MATEFVGTPAARVPRPGRRGPVALCAVAALTLAACGGASSGDTQTQAAEPVTLYTCLSDESVQAVIDAFGHEEPGARIDLFRAPTGELNARVAGDVRSGGLRADVVWGCDPLTVQAWVDEDLVGGWTPSDADAIPAQYRTDDYVGAHLLHMVAVHRTDVPAPTSWSDLATGNYSAAVPDPSVAASALGTLGWFAEEPGYGVDFYRALRSHGAVQVKTPDDVTAGVAQGIYDAGITTATSAYAARDDGSPVDVVWPQPGAVAIYGPIALARHSAHSRAAQEFISFVLSEQGQTVLGDSGSYPTRPGVAGPTIPDDAPTVSPDWAEIAADRDTILGDYQRVFGG